ncbi:MAG: D-glycero-beta-D-manno-heptose-7-phosphate kinase [Bacteroidota bacterium]|jgi:rfaE bifunctional protein kinase chain/domain|nr:D-glycero-beta-D-manno-heptose-7-phosphate kinase [Ignavibacteria bacterium]MCU7500217.1 D-glycero-beta-D-manno-heptose-7-phosphate kinase [Ignavibacteria bacterium]MCU7511590.1 D-glycero-beta-D-manno-heptose-7-phosphate kinase [Ignavibacteria bacterium]MCU7522079.1 D-glycero-beta-D-manno-heptose-7-phosphate kinase [Ignavibacteria bacterium]MCU7525226.1 D-glycero-beta-D-manno-heptose-7-phosphate kinase [Ignavibacteria bacterium]
MVKFSKERLEELKKNFEGKRIAVIGDMMLDCYFWGDVKRISPEAPVPVIEIDNEFYRFGGAANVALNILKLGGIPLPVGIIGYDNHGSIFTSLMEEAGIEAKGIIIDDTRPTTAKTRVIAQNQHIVRIDHECKDYIGKETEDRILKFVTDNIKDIDGIILQDYNKGVLTPVIIEEIINLSNKNNVIVNVDPKFNNFFNYKNVTVFKPNRKETEDAFGIRIRTEEDIHNAGNMLLDRLGSKYALLTLGEQGIAIFENGQNERRIPTKARKVADVSGAGDTVVSTLTVALTAGADICEASYLANYAGGLVCEEVGIVPIEADKLFEEVEKDSLSS